MSSSLVSTASPVAASPSSTLIDSVSNSVPFFDVLTQVRCVRRVYTLWSMAYAFKLQQLQSGNQNLSNTNPSVKQSFASATSTAQNNSNRPDESKHEDVKMDQSEPSTPSGTFLHVAEGVTALAVIVLKNLELHSTGKFA